MHKNITPITPIDPTDFHDYHDKMLRVVLLRFCKTFNAIYYFVLFLEIFNRNVDGQIFSR